MSTVSTAVILAGGAGLRLRPLTNQMPKAMVSVAGRPLLDWVIRWLLTNKVKHIVVGVAYMKEVVIEYLSHLQLPMKIDYSVHTVEGGTGEGFRLAIERYVRDEVFLAMNGDELTDIQIPEFHAFHRRHNGVATVAVSTLRSPFGVVKLEGANIRAFQEKAMLNSFYVSMGIYMFNHEILSFLPASGSIEKTTFPDLAETGRLRAFKHNGFWGTINTIKDLREVENWFTTRSDLNHAQNEQTRL